METSWTTNPSNRHGSAARSRARPVLSMLLMAAGLCFSAAVSAYNPPDPEPPEPAEDLPIIFVHGAAGSGEQYYTQAMRFASNGYPAERILAFEYPGTSPHSASELDDFVDDALARFDVDQVHLVAHSMGTSVGSSLGGYLSRSYRAAKVARYIGIDGLTSSSCPGDVTCMGIFASTDGTVGDTNAYFPDQSHVEVATSAESFAEQYEFLTGSAPTTTDVEPMTGPVEISGRAVYFPANEGVDGSQVRVWQIDRNTGQRIAGTPVASFSVGADGAWGPVSVDPQARYELELLGTGTRDYHFYFQSFPRDTDLIRLAISEPGSELIQNTNTGDGHSTLVIKRNKEWWSSRGSDNDILQVAGTNIITSDVGDTNIAIHAHDDTASPGNTTLAPLPYFNDQPFQAGVDIYLPAATPPNGTIELVSYPRGDVQQPQTINVPNWASSDHAISVTFNDYVQ